jgi:putative membrane protein
VKRNFSDHSANERTFLAWIRTGIGIMAFGFLVERFTIFLRVLQYEIAKKPLEQGWKASTAFGFGFLILGALTIAFGTLRYWIVKKQIDSPEWEDSNFFLWDVAFGCLLAASGLFLAVYLGKKALLF